MKQKVLGPVNIAYLFALSQFLMAWVLAWLYVRAAAASTTWRKTDCRKAARITMTAALGDVPRLRGGHAGDHLLGGATLDRREPFFAAGRRITGWQNGSAVAGDYMSAASFLGIAGMIAFYGYDGFMYSVGWLVAYLTVLLIVAEPLRNAGKYTMADVLAYRLRPAPRARDGGAQHAHRQHVLHDRADGRRGRAGHAAAQGVRGISYPTAVIGVGILMIVYVVFGGMLATTWVQIIKADPADGRDVAAQHPGAGPLRLQLRRFLRRRRARHAITTRALK